MLPSLRLEVGLFLSKPAVILLGLFTTAAGAKHFGVASWNLWDFYGLVLDEFWSPGARTLIFLGAFIQSFATIVTNVSSNAIPVGCDLAGLFPKYFTIVPYLQSLDEMIPLLTAYIRSEA